MSHSSFLLNSLTHDWRSTLVFCLFFILHHLKVQYSINQSSASPSCQLNPHKWEKFTCSSHSSVHFCFSDKPFFVPPLRRQSPTLANRGRSFIHICAVQISTWGGATLQTGRWTNLIFQKEHFRLKDAQMTGELDWVYYFYCRLSRCLPAQTEDNDVTTSCLLVNYLRLVMTTDGNRTKDNQKRVKKKGREEKKEWGMTAPRWSRALGFRWGCRGPAAPPAWPCSSRRHTRSPDAPSSLWSESKRNIPNWHSTNILQTCSTNSS